MDFSKEDGLVDADDMPVLCELILASKIKKYPFFVRQLAHDHLGLQRKYKAQHHVLVTVLRRVKELIDEDCPMPDQDGDAPNVN